eukprot:scaffold53523_cov57-Phaeocystis_antarctica.AAC.2
MVHGTGQTAVRRMSRRLVPLSSRRAAKHHRRGGTEARQLRREPCPSTHAARGSPAVEAGQATSEAARAREGLLAVCGPSGALLHDSRFFMSTEPQCGSHAPIGLGLGLRLGLGLVS